jgi:hypothetical protein
VPDCFGHTRPWHKMPSSRNPTDGGGSSR